MGKITIENDKLMDLVKFLQISMQNLPFSHLFIKNLYQKTRKLLWITEMKRNSFICLKNDFFLITFLRHKITK